jgi:hypothetical protein
MRPETDIPDPAGADNPPAPTTPREVALAEAAAAVRLIVTQRSTETAAGQQLTAAVLAMHDAGITNKAIAKELRDLVTAAGLPTTGWSDSSVRNLVRQAIADRAAGRARP